MMENKFIVCLHNSNLHTGHFWDKKPYKNSKGERKLTLHDQECPGEKIPDNFQSVEKYLRKKFQDSECTTIECAV